MVLSIINSPVRQDSSIWREIASSNSPSAGTSSPVSSKTMSPTTISFLGTSWRFPFLITFIIISSFTWFRISNFLFASISNQNATPVAKNIAQNIPIVSAYSLWMNEIHNDNNAAMSKIRIIGSWNFSKKSFQRGVFWGGVSRLLPNFSRLSFTCASVSPE